MSVAQRIGRLEKALSGAGQYINLWGCAIPRVELDTEVKRIRILAQIARGFIPKAAPADLEAVPDFLSLYTIPKYIETICKRANNVSGNQRKDADMKCLLKMQ